MIQTPFRKVLGSCFPGEKHWVFREHAPCARTFFQLWRVGFHFRVCIYLQDGNLQHFSEVWNCPWLWRERELYTFNRNAKVTAMQCFVSIVIWYKLVWIVQQIGKLSNILTFEHNTNLSKRFSEILLIDTQNLWRM